MRVGDFERFFDAERIGLLDLFPLGVPLLLYRVVDLLGIALGFLVSFLTSCFRRNSFSLLSFSSSVTTDADASLPRIVLYLDAPNESCCLWLYYDATNDSSGFSLCFEATSDWSGFSTCKSSYTISSLSLA